MTEPLKTDLNKLSESYIKEYGISPNQLAITFKTDEKLRKGNTNARSRKSGNRA